jgi:hypothetical protein
MSKQKIVTLSLSSLPCRREPGKPKRTRFLLPYPSKRMAGKQGENKFCRNDKLKIFKIYHEDLQQYDEIYTINQIVVTGYIL